MENNNRKRMDGDNGRHLLESVKTKIEEKKDELLHNERQAMLSKTIEERRRYVLKQRLILGGILLVLGIYLIGSIWFAFHFHRKTSINGVDVGGLSTSKALAAMQSAADEYSLTITGPDDSMETFVSSDLEMQVVGRDDIRALMKQQSALNWLFGSLFSTKYDKDVETEYNADALDSYLDTLKYLDESQMIAPEDASLEQASDGTVSISSETEGTTLRIDAAKEGIREAVGNYRREVSLSPYQVLPEVRAEDESLNARMNQWNTYLEAAGLTLRFPAENVTLNSKTIAGLLKDDGEEVTVSYDLVAVLVSGWKSDYNTYRNKFEFTTNSGETVTIMPWGNYGYQLNEEGTANDLISYIQNGDTGTHDPRWFKEGNDLSNMGLGGNYVEISIEDQYLWVYKDGEVVVETDVVTGDPNEDEDGKTHETYLGCYTVERKMEDVTLGTLDVQGYESPVSYWVPFNGGQGLHDAPWRYSFGGSIYKSNGSHGCVNCPKEIMDEIYENLEVGDAVIVY